MSIIRQDEGMPLGANTLFANDDGVAGTSSLFTWKAFIMGMDVVTESIETVYEDNAWVRTAF